MVAKMDKAAKKYECHDLNAIEWDKIRSITKKPIPTYAKTSIAQIIKKTVAKKYKEPYVKLGIVKGDTVLRVKDGSKHILDIKLVEASEGTGSPAPQLTGTQQILVKQYREACETLDTEMKSYLEEFAREAKTVETLFGRVQDDAVAAVRQPPEVARELVSGIQKQLQQAEDILSHRRDRLITDVQKRTMDPHRTKTGKPDPSLPATVSKDLAKEKLPIWNKANTRYSKMAAIVTQIENQVKSMRILVRNAQNSLGQNSDSKSFWTNMVTETIQQLDTELKEAQRKLTTKNNASQLETFINQLMERIVGDTKATNEDKLNAMNNATEQVKLVRVNGRLLHASIKSIREQIQQTLTQIPKQQLEDPAFKTPKTQLAGMLKAALATGKEWDAAEEVGLKAFEKMQALVGTDKGAAKKLIKQHAERVEKRNAQDKKRIDKENLRRKAGKLEK